MMTPTCDRGRLTSTGTTARLRAFFADETGDVPGWVLVTFVSGVCSRVDIRTRSHS